MTGTAAVSGLGGGALMVVYLAQEWSRARVKEIRKRLQ
jgi:hypothetical protein